MSQRDEHLPVSNKSDDVYGLPATGKAEYAGQEPRSSVLSKTISFIRRITFTSNVNTISSIPTDTSLRHIDSLKARTEASCGVLPINEANARAYPYRMICLLIITDGFNQKWSGTGFFISPRCVITAGHCVFSQGRWVKEVEIIPGGRGSEVPPFGSQKSLSFETTKGWKNSQREENDYGAIFLPNDELYRRIGRCHFGYRLTPDNSNDLKLTVSGYPENKKSVQWEGTGPVIEIKPNKLTYRIDTERGNSGSPVYIGENDIYYALGIHNYGLCPNFCTRITQVVIDNFSRWIDKSK